jgi:tripartite-type tricarboxylate transporter receptor subunit TctC
MKKVWITYLAAPVLALCAQGVHAADAVADYPSRPITLLVGFPAGGPADMAGRILAERLHAKWPDVRVVVENRGGANGTIAAAQLVKADPDGYTLFLVTKSLVNAKYLYKGLTFDPAKDFKPVALLLDMPNILVVGPSVKAAGYADLERDIRAKPETYTVFSSGNGSDPHLAAAEYQEKTGLKLRHIPYKGGAQGMVDMLSGRVDMSFATLGTVMGQLQQGKARAIAIGSPKRYPLLPDVPTFAEVGVRDFEPQAWYGVMAPAKLPPALAQKLNQAINEVMNTPQGSDALRLMGATPVNASIDDFDKLYKHDMHESGELIEHLGLKLD